MGSGLVRDLTVVGFCCVLRCMMDVGMDVTMVNLSFVGLLKRLPRLPWGVVAWLSDTLEHRAGHLSRKMGSVLVECFVGTLGAVGKREGMEVYLELCEVTRRLQMCQSCTLSSLEKRAGSFSEPLNIYVAMAGLEVLQLHGRHPLYFKLLGSLLALGPEYKTLKPVIASWSAFAQQHAPEHLDLVLLHLGGQVPCLSVELFCAFAPKVYAWWRTQEPSIFSASGFSRLSMAFRNAWTQPYILTVLKTLMMMAVDTREDSYLNSVIEEMCLKSLVLISTKELGSEQEDCGRQLVVVLKLVPQAVVESVARRVFCSVPMQPFSPKCVGQWYAAQMQLLSCLSAVKRALDECVEAASHLICNSSLFHVHGVRVRLKLLGKMDGIFRQVAVRERLCRELAVFDSAPRLHANCGCDHGFLAAFSPLELQGSATDKNVEALKITLANELEKRKRK